MDTESKASERDTSQLSDPPSDIDSSESDTSQIQTEWLATTRKRRATAGNRMKSMIANEEPDSDLELLFAEDDDDQGFSDVGDEGSDVHMDSSSDDEDENNANDEDLEGERELERQAKEKRVAQRKRKAQEAIPAKFRKKVRIDPTTASAPTPQPRPKKKSERSSWLPSPADLPTRASSRKTTLISKEQLHLQMAEREAKRLKQLAQMEKKQARLEAMKKPPMTQEERIAAAAIVEKRNSKSLNRWEEAEKQREEERLAKLAALNQRTLKGPVITFWSGKGQWDELELRALRPYVTVVEEKPKKKREKAEKGPGKAKGKEKGKDADKEKEIRKETEISKEVASGPHISVDKVENTVRDDTKADDKDENMGKITLTEQSNIQERSQKALEPGQDSEVSEKSSEGRTGKDEQEKPVSKPTEDSESLRAEQLNAEAAIVPVRRPEMEIGEAPEKEDEDEVKPEPQAVGAVSSQLRAQTILTSPGVNDQVMPAQETETATLVLDGADQEGNSESRSQQADTVPEPRKDGYSTSNGAHASLSSDAAAPSRPESGLATPGPPPIEDSPTAQSLNMPKSAETTASSFLAGPNGMDIDDAPPDTAAYKTPPGTLPFAAAPPAAADSRPTSPEPSAPIAESQLTELDAKPSATDARVQSLRDESAPDSKATSPRESEVAAVPDPPRDMNATRNAIIYQNFDELAMRDKVIQTQILFGRKMNKLASEYLLSSTTCSLRRMATFG